MKTMKTFFIYFLMLAGFFVIATFLEKGVIQDMYYKINGQAMNSDTLAIEVLDSKATNVNGYMNVKITNDSNEYIDSAYAKIDLLDEYGLNAMTKYVTVSDLEPGESKTFKFNFRGNKIKSYEVAFVSELPDKSNIINILGWEIDKTNLFGLGIDLTNINGVDVTKYFSFSNIRSFARNSWSLGIGIAKSIPLWAYAIASLIVLWYI